MKISQVQIKEITVLLGRFSTTTFNYFKCKPNVSYYSEFCMWNIKASFEEQIIFACNRANLIIFVLNKVQFPINPKVSYTCRELEIICNNDRLFNKTIFVKGDNVIDFDKNLVLN